MAGEQSEPVKGEGARASTQESSEPRSRYRTNYDFTEQDVMRAMADYRRDWEIVHNQLLRIQDQYMPRG